MQPKPRAGSGHRRHSAPYVLIIAGLAALSMLLAGCGAGVQAAGKAAGLAQNQPPTAAVTPLSTGTDGWSDAGQVTVTPAAGDNSNTGAADATAAPPDNAQAVQFAGPVENLPGTGDWSGPWQVGGRLVHVTSSTNIDQRRGRVATGTQVAVEGWQQPDGAVDAGWIIVLGANGTTTPESGPGAAPTATPVPAAVVTPLPANPGQDNNQNNGEDKNQNDRQDNQQNDEQNGGNPHGSPVEFRGNVEQLPASGLVGTWRISGRTVNVNARTRVQQKEGALANGTYVQVMGWQQPDGSINAASIQVKRGGNGGDEGNANGNNGKGNGNGNGKGNGNGNGNGNGKGKDHK